ncbi:VOC family protein [Gordonia rhizosphera]|nr:VOC family protein [Gordonia rhizosphera]
MATATIGSMLLSSDDPHALARWYATVFEARIGTVSDGPGYDIIELDGFYIMFDKRDDVSGPNTGGARAILNVEVDDPLATAARIDALGAEWVSALEDKGGGTYFGTVKDPDGNWLQIVRLADEFEAEMSANPTSPYSGFAVRDLDAADAFYREVLGMRVLRFPVGVLGIRINRGTTVLVYPKPDHEPATHTILNLPVDDLERAVDDLAGRGVEFLRYDGFDQDERGIARGGGRGPDIAWFTDPSGNVIAVHAK